MLARRLGVVTRPATTIRRLGGSHLQRRFIFPSESQLLALPRPNTWLAKLRFRPDGKPRSKLIAFGFGSLILFSLLSYLTLTETIEYEEETRGLLAKMIFVQQTDMAYDSVNFDDPISTLSYFKKLYLCFTWNIEMGEQRFNDLMTLVINKRTKGVSEKSAEVQAQHIMRLAAEKIHGAIRELNQDSESIVNTAEFVLLVMEEAVKSLLDLSYEDESFHRFAFQTRDDTKKDAGVLKDYEVLG